MSANQLQVLRRAGGAAGASQLQLDQVSRALLELAGIPLLDGALLEGVVFDAAGVTKIRHTLGRKPRGVMVVRTTARFDLPSWDASNPRPETELWLDSGGVAATASLWVF